MGPQDGSTSRRDGPPKRRPIPQMPPPLAPQSAPNRSYSQGSQSSLRHRRPSEFDYGMPNDGGTDAGPNTPDDWQHSPPRVIPSLAERPVCVNYIYPFALALFAPSVKQNTSSTFRCSSTPK